MNITRRRTTLGLILTATVAGSTAAWGQAYPSKSIRIVVPYTPGGSNDVLARILADRLGRMWSQPLVVDNRPGAAGNIGADNAAKSPPDGYTLLIAANNILTINAAMFAKMPFDPAKDLTSVTLLGTVPFVLVAGPSAKVSSVAELIALSKSKAGGVSYASSGIGSPQHLSAELFRSLARISMTHVAYKGAAPAITDLLGGVVDIQFGSVSTLLPHIRAGKLTALAVAGTRRVPSLPNVPTMIEAGVAGYDSEPWVGLSVPSGVPDAVIQKIGRDVREVFNSPEVVQKLVEQGIDPRPTSSAEMAKLVEVDRAKWGRIITEAGIKAE